MNERVSVRVDAHVAEVTMERADKFNAVDMAMIEALVDAARQVAGDDSVRAVVLAGAGENFCAGIDLGVFMAPEPPFSAAAMRPQPGSHANLFQSPALAWRDVPVPVIAAVQGICYGAGLQIALGADLRIAAPSTRMAVMEVEWGIVPDMGITVTARGLVRADRLKELALTGRVVDGAEAASLGLATRLEDEPLEAARRLARDIAGRSPDATAGIKELLNSGFRAGEADALALEAEIQLGILGRPNQAEAVRARLEKREPEFATRSYRSRGKG